MKDGRLMGRDLALEYSEIKQQVVESMMSPEEVLKRWESLQDVNRDDFYTCGELDLKKARKLGKLHQIRGFSCDGRGRIVTIALHNDFSGHVYFVRAENGLIKIGRTQDIRKRLNSLNVDSPVRIDLIKSELVENAAEVEGWFHSFFECKRVRGEWFELDDEDLEEAMLMLGGFAYGDH